METTKKCRNTKNRQVILKILGLFEVPATVDDIYVMSKYLKAPMSVSTIYRNLEFLEQKDIVVKAIMMDDNKARYELHQPADRHYIICVKCNRMQPIQICPVHDREQDLQKITGYEITGHKLEVYGYCPECKKL